MTDRDRELVSNLRCEFNIARVQRAEELNHRKLSAAIGALNNTTNPDLGPFLTPPTTFRHRQDIEDFAQKTIDRWVAEKYYGHKDRSGATVATRLNLAGFPTLYAQENIAFDHPSAQWVFDSFMQSSVHRANILNPGNVYVGIGTLLHDPDGTETWLNTKDTPNHDMTISVPVRLWCAVFYTPRPTA